MRSSRINPAELTLGVLLALTALAGCSTGATTAAPPAGSAVASSASIDPSSTPAPSAVPTPLAVAAGTLLTDAQVAALPKDTTAYVLGDGTKVAVVKGEPVPAPVLAEIAAGGLAAVQAGTAPGGVDSTPATEATFKAFLVQKTIALGGRQIVAVIHTSWYTEANVYTTGYYVTSNLGHNYPTAAEAAAVGMKYAESVGAASHPVVVFDFPL